MQRFVLTVQSGRVPDSSNIIQAFCYHVINIRDNSLSPDSNNIK
jgi:hypothetical protein